VGAVEAKAMGPTIIHVEAVIGGDGTRECRWDGWGGQLRQFGYRDGGSIGTEETNLASHEFVEMFLVFGSKVCYKFANGFVGHWAHTPKMASHGEDTSQFKQKDCEVNEGHSIGNGVTANGHNALDLLMETFPKGFNGFVGGPQGHNAGSIGF